MEGDFDFSSLAKATPGYVGADLAALTGAAGIIAVKRIFQQLSDGSLVLPGAQSDPPAPSTMDVDDGSMPIDVGTVPTSTLFGGLSSQLSSHSIAHFLIAHPEPLTEEQLGPICITATDFTAALKQVQPSSKREGFATIPDVTWSDIGALHGTREELQMAIVQPIKRPELFSSVGITAASGVLLWGPPGCGKTLLAKAVANESRANFISVKGPELLNKVKFSLNRRYIFSELIRLPSTSVRAKGLSDKYFHVRELPRPVSSSLTNLTRSSQGAMIAWCAISVAVSYLC